jgi:tRNA dimethylallyltransferase
MACTPKAPLIAVIGATGTGKSKVRESEAFLCSSINPALKLAVSLAKRFGGEIINGDALQIYEGLPIVTNKIPPAEMCGVKHHLLGRLRLDEETWSVSQFTTEALKVIEGIRSRGKLPILVGGTHYYTQSLLLQDQTLQDETREKLSIAEQEEKWPILKGTEEKILAKLWEVDPAMASRWHPKDARRIRRSLEIWLQTGRRASELYADQRNRTSSKQNTVESSSPPDDLNQQRLGRRFDSLTFCTHVVKGELDQRISKRVDQMLEEGLVDEVQLMYARYRELSLATRPPDLSRGIWIAIGYKEFAEYLAAQDSASTDADRLKALREASIEKTKIATRQYAKSQMRWIKHKLLPPLLEEGGETAAIVLTCNEFSMWSEHVEMPAIELADEFLQGKPLNVGAESREALSQLLSNTKATANGPLPQAQTCEVCGVVMISQHELERHPKTTRHKRALKTQRRHERVKVPVTDVAGFV